MSATISISPTHVYRPSTARLVVLDGFAPVPRGTAPAAPAMPAWPVKDPADVLDYSIDIAAAVAGDDGDAVSNVAVAITPADSAPATLNSASMDGTLVVLWIGGGISGTQYTVALTITLASGRALTRSVALPVIALSGAASTVAVLTSDTGQTLTDAGGNPIVLGS